MGLINRNTDYAIRALCYIAKKDKEVVVSVSELIKRLRMPRPFLRKILQALNKNKLLVSYRGQGGGFRLNVPADRILLVDLIKIFQRRFSINECIFKKDVCPDRKVCALRKKIGVIEKHMLDELKAITIASLLKAR